MGLIDEGKKVPFNFYLKDDTPCCAKEACDFRDLPKFKKSKAAVFGVSILGEASKKFADKFELNFPLLADAARSWASCARRI